MSRKLMHEAAALTVLAGAAVMAFGVQAGVDVSSAAAAQVTTTSTTSSSTTTTLSTTTTAKATTTTSLPKCDPGAFVVTQGPQGGNVTVTLKGNCGQGTTAYLAVYLAGAPSTSGNLLPAGAYPQTRFALSSKPDTLPGSGSATTTSSLTLTAALPDDACYTQLDVSIGGPPPLAVLTNSSLYGNFPTESGYGTGWVEGLLLSSGNQACSTSGATSTTSSTTTAVTIPSTSSTTASTSGSTGTSSSTSSSTSTPPTTASTSPASGGTSSTSSSTTIARTSALTGSTSSTTAEAVTQGASGSGGSGVSGGSGGTPTGTSPTTLAYTGLNADALAGLGGLLILLGGGVFFASRRRPSHHQG